MFIDVTKLKILAKVVKKNDICKCICHFFAFFGILAVRRIVSLCFAKSVVYIFFNEKEQNMYIYYVYIQSTEHFCKMSVLSYGYHMGMLWVSYGKPSYPSRSWYGISLCPIVSGVRDEE